jgi:hypothetical protein
MRKKYHTLPVTVITKLETGAQLEKQDPESPAYVDIDRELEKDISGYDPGKPAYIPRRHTFIGKPMYLENFGPLNLQMVSKKKPGTTVSLSEEDRVSFKEACLKFEKWRKDKYILK